MVSIRNNAKLITNKQVIGCDAQRAGQLIIFSHSLGGSTVLTLPGLTQTDRQLLTGNYTTITDQPVELKKLSQSYSVSCWRDTWTQFYGTAVVAVAKCRRCRHQAEPARRNELPPPSVSG